MNYNFQNYRLLEAFSAWWSQQLRKSDLAKLILNELRWKCTVHRSKALAERFRSVYRTTAADDFSFRKSQFERNDQYMYWILTEIWWTQFVQSASDQSDSVESYGLSRSNYSDRSIYTPPFLPRIPTYRYMYLETCVYTHDYTDTPELTCSSPSFTV